MGGFNSGRTSGKPTAEACQSIVLDLNVLLRHREGLVVCRQLIGNRGGAEFRIGVRISLEDETLTIAHKTFRHASNVVPAAHYQVELIAFPAAYGGKRWHMMCPGSASLSASSTCPTAAHGSPQGRSTASPTGASGSIG